MYNLIKKAVPVSVRTLPVIDLLQIDLIFLWDAFRL